MLGHIDDSPSTSDRVMEVFNLLCQNTCICDLLNLILPQNNVSESIQQRNESFLELHTSLPNTISLLIAFRNKTTSWVRKDRTRTGISLSKILAVTSCKMHWVSNCLLERRTFAFDKLTSTSRKSWILQSLTKPCCVWA